MSEILKKNHIRELTAHEIFVVSGGDNDDESFGHGGSGGGGGGGGNSTNHGGGGSTISDFSFSEGSFPSWE